MQTWRQRPFCPNAPLPGSVPHSGWFTLRMRATALRLHAALAATARAFTRFGIPPGFCRFCAAYAAPAGLPRSCQFCALRAPTNCIRSYRSLVDASLHSHFILPRVADRVHPAHTVHAATPVTILRSCSCRWHDTSHYRLCIDSTPLHRQ